MIETGPFVSSFRSVPFHAAAYVWFESSRVFRRVVVACEHGGSWERYVAERGGILCIKIGTRRGTGTFKFRISIEVQLMNVERLIIEH